MVVLVLACVVKPVFADTFTDTLNSGKSMGQQMVTPYSPNNLNSTLSNRGLGGINSITPKAGEAQQYQSTYEGFYTNPSGMSSVTSEAGTFVQQSYQTRTMFDLSNDPTFGNKCLETVNGQCTRWSSSRDIITQAYPDCEKTYLPRYGDPATYEECTGTKEHQDLECVVRTPVRITTETIYQPCAEANIEYQPGQIYAVCKDYVTYYKQYIYEGWYVNDCWCEWQFGSYCYGWPSNYVYGDPPPGATYLGRYGVIQACQEQSGWDLGLTTIYDWYAKYSHSVVERVFIDYDAPCGEPSRLQDMGCSMTHLEQCDPNGNNCLVTVDNGEPTGALASTYYLTHTSQQTGTISCDYVYYSCDYCDDFGNCWNCGWHYCSGRTCDWEGNCYLTPPCYPVANSSCSGSCPSNSTLVSQPSNSAVSIGYQTTISGSPSSCPGNPGGSLAIVRTDYYSDPRVCNSFSGSLENYTVCMDGQYMSINNGIKTVQLTTNTVTEQSSSTEYRMTVNYVRKYGGPDVKPYLNGWYMKVKWACNNESDTCQTLRDRGCTMYERTCADPNDPFCQNVNYIYRCGGGGEILGYDVAIVCAGDIRCIGSECSDASYNANQDFAKAVQMAEILKAAQVDASQTEVFPGKPMICNSTPHNCCVANTGGVSIGDYITLSIASYKAYTFMSAGIGKTMDTLAASMTNSINAIATKFGYIQPEMITPYHFQFTSFAGVNDVQILQYPEGELIVYNTASAQWLTYAATAATVIQAVWMAYNIATTVYNIMFACTADDMKTSSYLGFNLCHLVGERCAGRFLGVCYKRENVYCCFNSILARLIHEQGRPQVGRGWGSLDNPDCAGLTFGELSALDFSQMDLTEYMQYVQEKSGLSAAEMEEIQNRTKQYIINGGQQP